MNIVTCVWRGGGCYTLEYLMRLYGAVLTHLTDPLVVCLTDQPVPALPRLQTLPLREGWPGWWSKLELFARFTRHRVVYFDLDTVIKGPLDPLFRFTTFTALADFNHPSFIQSSVLAWEGDYSYLHKEFAAAPAQTAARFAAGACGRVGDQAYIEQTLRVPVARWQELLPGAFASYKSSTVEAQARASVICYHGLPRPHETGWAGTRPETPCAATAGSGML